ACCPGCDGAVSRFLRKADADHPFPGIIRDRTDVAFRHAQVGTIASLARFASETEEDPEQKKEAERAAGAARRDRVLYQLVQCSGCGRGALATLHIGKRLEDDAELAAFYPTTAEEHRLSPNVPSPLRQEFREAELCASVRAYRAGSAMLR